MTTPELLIVGIGACVLGHIYYVWFCDLFAERARQELYVIRDTWFDYVADGHITFDSELYRQSREHIHNAIRYCHSTNLWTLLFAAWILRRTSHQIIEDLMKHDADADPQTRDRIEKIRTQSCWIILKLAIRRSPLTTVLLGVVAAFLMLCTTSNERLRAMKDRIEMVATCPPELPATLKS